MAFLWFLSELRTPFLNSVMQFITYFGQELFILPLICVLYWCLNKRFAYQLAFSYFTAGLLVQTLKVTFRIPRPWILDSSFPPVESAVPGATGYSFPSGHTQGATCLFSSLALATHSRIYKGLCVCAFLLIGFSRMYLGCHTPKDVLVSLVLSGFITWLIWRFQVLFLEDSAHTVKIAWILAFFSCVLTIYTFFLYKNDIIAIKYASDCFKASGAGFGFSLGWYLERVHIRFRTNTTTWGGQVLKLLIGISIAVLLKEGLPFFIGTSPLANMAKYFILVLWVIAIYPFCFCQMNKK